MYLLTLEDGFINLILSDSLKTYDEFSKTTFELVQIRRMIE